MQQGCPVLSLKLGRGALRRMQKYTPAIWRGGVDEAGAEKASRGEAEDDRSVVTLAIPREAGGRRSRTAGGLALAADIAGVLHRLAGRPVGLEGMGKPRKLGRVSTTISPQPNTS